MSKDVPYRFHSPSGWWIASYILRAEWDDKPSPSDRSRCLAWENTIILKAPDREAAFVKAVELGEEASGSELQSEGGNHTGRWVFEGLTTLCAIHDEPEDGAEVLWDEYPRISVGKVRSFVKKKEELEAFDDSWE